MNHSFIPQTFIKNKYYKIYFNIINLALCRDNIKNTYFESHHIIPKSISPEYAKEQWNIVKLTAREHFICHKLLTKFTVGDHRRKMVYALWGMINQKNKHQQKRHLSTSHSYEHAKKLMAETLSSARKGQTLEERFGVAKAQEIKEKLKKRRRPAYSNEKRKTFSNIVKQNHIKGVYKNTGFNGRKLERKTCSHCGKTCDVGNFTRHHGDKCKLRLTSK